MTISFVNNAHFATSAGAKSSEEKVAVKVGSEFFVPQLLLAQ